MAPRTDPSRPIAPSSPRERFFASYYWLILKNLLGWTLILMALVAGPLVPGPGGIPLFLIGFALVTFPGKRRLTARVLRGRRIRWQRRSLLLVITAVSVAVPTLALSLFGTRPAWLHGLLAHGLLPRLAVHLVAVLFTWLVSWGVILLVNLLLRTMPPIRRRVRPWLRNHRVRLLPPRRRHRLPHEPGIGPLRLKDEILGILKRSRRSASELE